MASIVAKGYVKGRDSLLPSGHRLGVLEARPEENVCSELSLVTANMLKSSGDSSRRPLCG